MAVPSFFSFVQLVTMFTLFLHETPQWYFYNDKPQEVFYTIILITQGLEALNQIYADPIEAEKVAKAMSTDAANSKAAAASAQQEVKCIQCNISQGALSTYQKYGKALWVGVIIIACQQFTGITAVTVYAPLFFGKQPGADVLTVIFFVVNVVFSFVVIPIVLAVGRRTLLLLGGIICAAAHFVCFVSIDLDGENAARNWAFNIGIYVYIAAFSVTFGPVWYCFGH